MIFGTFCAVMTVHIFFLYPETSGKTLEEIDELFDSNIPAWRSRNAGANLEDKVEDVKREAAVVSVEKEEHV